MGEIGRCVKAQRLLVRHGPGGNGDEPPEHPADGEQAVEAAFRFRLLEGLVGLDEAAARQHSGPIAGVVPCVALMPDEAGSVHVRVGHL